MKQWPEDGIVTDHDVVPDLLDALLNMRPEYTGFGFPNAPAPLDADTIWRKACAANRVSGDVDIVGREHLRAALFLAFKLGQAAQRHTTEQIAAARAARKPR